MRSTSGETVTLETIDEFAGCPDGECEFTTEVVNSARTVVAMQHAQCHERAEADLSFSAEFPLDAVPERGLEPH
jgi:hypothetical protein